MPLLFFVSCSELDNFTPNQAQMKLSSEALANDNNLIINNAEELLNITSNLLADLNISTHGRVYGETNVTACAPVMDHFIITDHTHYDTLIYFGTLTLDFGTGGTCTGGVQRKGKVIDNFLYILNTKREIYSSRERITFEGFERDSQLMGGTFLIESTSEKPVNFSTTDGRIEYTDGTTMTMNGSLTFESNFEDDGISYSNKVAGYLNGRTRTGSPFHTKITELVEYRYDCSKTQMAIPVKGTLVSETS